MVVIFHVAVHERDVGVDGTVVHKLVNQRNYSGYPHHFRSIILMQWYVQLNEIRQIIVEKP